MLEVVSGLLIRDGRVFLQQRQPGKRLEMMWETPGGKVEPNESHHDALRRELSEELGIEVLGIPELSVWCGTVTFPVQGYPPLFKLLYRIVDFVGEPTSREGQTIGWFTMDEVNKLILTPGTKLALPSIAKQL